MEEFNKKWEELKKKIEENKNSEKCETVAANSGNNTYYTMSSKPSPNFITTKNVIKNSLFNHKKYHHTLFFSFNKNINKLSA